MNLFFLSESNLRDKLIELNDFIKSRTILSSFTNPRNEKYIIKSSVVYILP